MGKKSKRVRNRGGGRPQRPITTTTTAAGGGGDGISFNHHRALVEAGPQLDEFLKIANGRLARFGGFLYTNLHNSSDSDNPGDWHAQGNKAFMAYYMVLLGGHTFYNQDDYMFLRKVRGSKKSPLHSRLFALIYDASFRLVKHDAMADTLEFCDKAIALCDSVSEREKEQTIELPRIGECFLGMRIENARKMIKDILSNVNIGQFAGRHGPYDFTGPTFSVPLIAGFVCECHGCDTKRESVGGRLLKVCSRCQMAFYCSEECLRKAWRDQGHKTVCRKDGEFKVGKTAVTLRAFGSFKTGDMVRLVAPNPDGDAHDENPQVDCQIFGSQRRHRRHSGGPTQASTTGIVVHHV